MDFQQIIAQTFWIVQLCADAINDVDGGQKAGVS